MRELLEQHRLAAPPNAAHLAASVSRATADVLSQALAKTPNERFQSARHFMDALERVMAPLTQRHARNRLMVSGEDSLSGAQSITQAATIPGEDPSLEVSGSTLSTAISAYSASTAKPTLSSTQPPPRIPSNATRKMRRATSVLWYAAAGVLLGAVALFALAMARGLSFAELWDPDADGTLEISADPGAPPATVLVDGAPQGDTPLRLNVSPGAHRVRLLRPGDPEIERDVTVGPREQLHLGVPPAR
jgi:hypothetical protein